MFLYDFGWNNCRAFLVVGILNVFALDSELGLKVETQRYPQMVRIRNGILRFGTTCDPNHEPYEYPRCTMHSITDALRIIPTALLRSLCYLSFLVQLEIRQESRTPVLPGKTCQS